MTSSSSKSILNEGSEKVIEESLTDLVNYVSKACDENIAEYSDLNEDFYSERITEHGSFSSSLDNFLLREPKCSPVFDDCNSSWYVFDFLRKTYIRFNF